MRVIRKKELLRNILFYSIFVLVFLSIRSSVFASYIVPTPSMNPTILEGDMFFTNKLAYRLKVPMTKKTVVEWSSPSRGEIVIFKFPLDESELYTKRVIAIEGDIVEIAGGRIYINGKIVPKTYTGMEGQNRIFEEELDGVKYHVQHMAGRTPLQTMKRLVVPEGHIFVCGDNRDNSYDSRYWGTLPLENVEGKIMVRWFSVDMKKWLPRFERIGPV